MTNERRGHISLMDLQGKRHRVGDEERSLGTSCDRYLGVNLIMCDRGENGEEVRWIHWRKKSIQWGRLYD